MDKIQYITNYIYEYPTDHNYEMMTGKTLRFAFCFDLATINNYLTGSSKSAQLSFFKYSKSHGQENIPSERMT
jgi:hypothetical protein